MKAGEKTNKPLPTILAGPIIRRTCRNQLSIWLVCSEKVDALHLSCYQHENCLAQQRFGADHDGHVQLGKHAHLHLLHWKPEQKLPEDVWLSYDITFETQRKRRTLSELQPHLCYGEAKRPDFIIKSHINQVLHGSCRKPHHPDRDGLLCVDEVLEKARQTTPENTEQPALLMMTGDQIYADDVAGPMLNAVQQVVNLLGIKDESMGWIPGLDSSSDLYASSQNFYGRTRLLPDNKANATLRESFFMGAKKPIFTSANADNHLITLGEVLAMYLLVWSPVLWDFVTLEKQDLPKAQQQRYDKELKAIRHFIRGLPKVQRALAHVPVYMIFDDHDVTDDWNLTRGWEESAYGHEFSRRIIGNTLIGYLLCQGWGNAPEEFSPDLIMQAREVLRHEDHQQHDALVERLLRFAGWQYNLPTTPKMIVLDTRTRRWRSESNAAQPSGLLDWEALMDLQQELIGEKAVILVSPAPIFGVKLIEVVQRIFTWFGHALTVDAENWMAHPGAANVILNIFRHQRTPHNFVILSGDVHYSFAYDVRLRHRTDSPHIWQITSSGIMSTFPEKLLRTFDRLNRWLFASHSPLNWLTRRRHMHIRPRRPGEHEGRYRHQRLLNGNGIGRVSLNESGEPVSIEVLWSNGQRIGFSEGYEGDWL